ncbi:MAG: hypothetical protein ACRETH_01905, partial [Steroidobacteraceae bacterium]
LTTDLAGAFRRFDTYHWRPGLFAPGKETGAVTDPHGRPARTPVGSVAKIVLYLSDFTAGYWLKVRPRLARSSLVVFDRYAQDLQVDPLRYRYGGPGWLSKLLAKIVPRPDLFLILDLSPAESRLRKDELPAAALAQQRSRYRRLAGALPRAFLLDASQPAETVAAYAREIAFGALSQRYHDRKGLSGGEIRHEALHWLSGVLSTDDECKFVDGSVGNGFAGTRRNSFLWTRTVGNRGYLTPRVSRAAAVAGLDLYGPRRLKARLAKRLLGAAMRVGLADRVLPRVVMTTRTSPASGEGAERSLLDHISHLLQRDDLRFAISTGNPNQHRTPMLKIMTPACESLGYARVGWNRTTKALVRHEASICATLARQELSFMAPQILHIGRWNSRVFAIQSAPAQRATPAPLTFNAAYLAIVTELSRLELRMISLDEAPLWRSLIRRSESITQPYYRDLLRRGLAAVYNSLGSRPLPFHFCHGDYAPWNALAIDSGLLLYDWECARRQGPPGWDICNFFVRSLWRNRRTKPVQVSGEFLPGGIAERWMAQYLEGLGMRRADSRPLCLLFLLNELIFSLVEPRENFASLQFLQMLISLFLFEDAPTPG